MTYLDFVIAGARSEAAHVVAWWQPARTVPETWPKMFSQRLSQFFKTIYSQLTRLSWRSLLAAFGVHYALSAKAMWRVESDEITVIIAIF